MVTATVRHGMGVRILGWPGEPVELELDRRAFAYAGKVGADGTGTAVLESEGRVVAAVSFDRDRTAADRWWIRYISVRTDCRGQGYGPKLLGSVGSRLLDRGTAVRIAVNNPYAYEAAYKAGFGYLGETVGLGELVLERPSDGQPDRYRAGFEQFASRSLSDAEQRFVSKKRGAGPPATLSTAIDGSATDG